MYGSRQRHFGLLKARFRSWELPRTRVGIESRIGDRSFLSFLNRILEFVDPTGKRSSETAKETDAHGDSGCYGIPGYSAIALTFQHDPASVANVLSLRRSPIAVYDFGSKPREAGEHVIQARTELGRFTTTQNRFNSLFKPLLSVSSTPLPIFSCSLSTPSFS